MNLAKVVAFAACVLAGLTQSGLAQITINGVTDRTTYVDTVTFTVVSQAGYTDTAFLNTNPVPVGISVTVARSDYYNLLVTRVNDSNPLDVSQRLIRFVIRDSARASTENGLPVWMPYPLVNSASNEFAGAHLRVIAPASYPPGLSIPVVVWIENDEGHAVRVNARISTPGQPDLQIKRGVGSCLLASTNPAGTLVYTAQVAGLQSNKVIEIESSTTWTPVSGQLAANTVWPEDSRIHVTANLTNPAGSTLTIGAGTVVSANPGIDIGNLGNIVINGTTERPVVFAPATPGQPWGGFVQHADNAQFTATGAIFTGSGAYQGCWFTGHGCSSSLSGIGSHRGEQALISLRGANCNLTLSDCAAIYLAGQFGHSASGGSYSYAITLDRFLMQRCTTGGEFTGALFKVNDSAFIECAEDLSTGDSPDFVDGDNDALYIVNAPTGQFHGFTNTLFGWTKDDGVDSGGSGPGIFHYQDCWFEGILHEGNSLSGAQNASPHADKMVNHHHGVFLNCGQGVEDGYGAPTGSVERCLFTGNLVGARFGDNYDWQYYGFLRVTNSISIDNYHEVWGVNFQDWTYRTSAMDIQGNWLTAPNTNHPNNFVWDPAADGSDLSEFLTIPPDSDVGVAFVTWRTQFPLSEVTNAIPVGLSTFSSHEVSVDYTVESREGILEAGTLRFAPGELIKTIQLTPASVAAHDPVRVALHQPVRGQLTGTAQLLFLSTPSNKEFIAAGSEWKYNDLGGDQGTVWRARGFNDSGWSNGVAQLGFGDNDETTPIRRTGTNGLTTVTFYFRHPFNVVDAAAFDSLNLWLLRDDGGVVYLNGDEVYRSPSLPALPAVISYQTLANAQGGSTPPDNTVDQAVLDPGVLVPGTNVAAVEIHQHDTGSSDVSFDLSLVSVPSTRLRIDLVHFDDGWVLYWADETALLESADSIDGVWSLVPRAQTPFALTTDAPQKFYRLRRP